MARAPYAAMSERGRLYAEPVSPTRGDFRRDCDRLIHSSAFRRLAHKTQVFIPHEGDHYRTRLTHTLEVTQVARSIARALGLDEDLAEASALGHDLGHSPFGHAGERALNRCMKEFGGFDHNAQTLAVVTRLEHRYAAFDGLNLTWDTLEGLVKHNGPLTAPSGHGIGHYAAGGVSGGILEYCRLHDLDLDRYPGAEAQAGAIADDIAYDTHDIDDGLRAELFSLDELASVPLIDDILREIAQVPGADEPARRVHELIRRVITRMIEDVIVEGRRRLAAIDAQSVGDIRAAPSAVIGFSPAMAETDRAIKAFLFPKLDRHERVMRIMTAAEGVVADLFTRYVEQPAELPPEWRAEQAADPAAQARRIADFIAGMTDRYALMEHARLFDSVQEFH